MIVADTNLVAYLLIEGTGTSAARAVYTQDPSWTLPPLWRSEFLNVLATTVRAGLLTPAEARQAWRGGVDLFGHREAEPGGETVLTAAIADRISAYDAQFVVLARSLGVSLVTADKALARACPDVAVSMGNFIAS